MLKVYRVGFTGSTGDTPEDALSQLLERIEDQGQRVISVSVTRPGTLPGERFEAYIVVRRGTMCPTCGHETPDALLHR